MTTPPVRIQRRRTKGWTTPLDPHGRKAIYVGRGTRWGNPNRVVPSEDGWAVAHDHGGAVGIFACHTEARRFATEAYRYHLKTEPDLAQAARRELAGRDLACWCKTTEPCHAAVLLEIANG